MCTVGLSKGEFPRLGSVRGASGWLAKLTKLQWWAGWPGGGRRGGGEKILFLIFFVGFFCAVYTYF